MSTLRNLLALPLLMIAVGIMVTGYTLLVIAGYVSGRHPHIPAPTWGEAFRAD
jgi:hypothetical protein